MDTFLQLTVSGLSTGMIYALAAVGFVVIYKASDVINFAQGDLLLFGTYLIFFSVAHSGCYGTVDRTCSATATYW